MGDPVPFPIEDVLDLHQFAPRDAQSVLEEWLIATRERGMKQLRIVHGRGIGVQRDMVRRVLAAQMDILEFRDAPLEAGGWGATIVTRS